MSASQPSNGQLACPRCSCEFEAAELVPISVCPRCGVKLPGNQAATSDVSSELWECKVCTGLNKPDGLRCWNCNNPKGAMATAKARAALKNRPEPDNKALRFLGRLFIGTIIWIVLGAFVFLSAMPYGGGNQLLLILWFASTVAIPIWALFAFATRKPSEDA